MSPAVQNSSNIELVVVKLPHLTERQVAAYRQAFKGPLPDSGWIIVAQENGQVVGFSTLQSIWHVGGTWVAPTHRGSGVFTRLIEKVFEALPGDACGALVTTDNPKMPSVLTRLGLEEVHTKLFRWVRR